ncbi:MAG: hypothetical protein MZV64_09460 [Ignavibacteriales bacterium]|nr:hypothetical protein [Ignavibacteriales bacterium]
MDNYKEALSDPFAEELTDTARSLRPHRDDQRPAHRGYPLDPDPVGPRPAPPEGTRRPSDSPRSPWTTTATLSARLPATPGTRASPPSGSWPTWTPPATSRLRTSSPGS